MGGQMSKEYFKKYYYEHREKKNQQSRDRYIIKKEQIRLTFKKWHGRNPMHLINNYRKKRDELFMLLGGVCVKCSFSDKRALQFDHINGGGTKELKQMSTRGMIYFYLRNPDLAKKYLQILCANCNQIKTYENKEVRVVNLTTT